MIMHKLFKGRNLFNILFACILSIPLVSIAVRCGYVMLNKNAYLSYGGNTGQTTEYVDTKNLSEGMTYTLTLNSNSQMNFVNTGLLKVTILDGNANFTNFNNFMNNNRNNVKGFLISNAGTQPYIQMMDSNYNRLDDFNFSGSYPDREILINFIIEENYLLDINNLQEKRVYNDAYLDNAFEYSIDKFINDNNFGQLDFFSWFNNVFFSGDTTASLYIHFVNWYMNYMLLVSCGYILFLMLMWFVNFVRKILDRSMNFYDY